MQNSAPLPGTLEHQTLLACLQAHYAADPRLRALLLFGSLSGETWDALSDLDLDLVLDDSAPVEIQAELQRLVQLLEGCDQPVALAFAIGEDELEIVLASRLQLSLRCHHLATTKAAVTGRFLVLAGDLAPEAIRAAGQANPGEPAPPLRLLVEQSLRELVVLGVAIQRRRRWLALELLGRLRQRSLEIFTLAHNGDRPFYFFEQQASPYLQTRLSQILPGADWPSIVRACLAALELYEQSLPELTHQQEKLGDTDRALLQALRDTLGA